MMWFNYLLRRTAAAHRGCNQRPLAAAVGTL
jgi:hypothetical protein